MVILPHALTGAVLGKGRHPLVALGLGIVSHYALDQIPHRDYDLERQGPYLVPLELLGVAALVRPLDLDAGALAGAVGGLLPDVAATLRPESLLGRLNGSLHPDFSRVGNEGWLTQALCLATAAFLLARRRSR